MPLIGASENATPILYILVCLLKAENALVLCTNVGAPKSDKWSKKVIFKPPISSNERTTNSLFSKLTVTYPGADTIPRLGNFVITPTEYFNINEASFAFTAIEVSTLAIFILQGSQGNGSIVGSGSMPTEYCNAKAASYASIFLFKSISPKLNFVTIDFWVTVVTESAFKYALLNVKLALPESIAVKYKLMIG